MTGALLVAGTASDAGKTVVVAGMCRWLARQGVKVAPFKAQNMALNSGVTAEGAEIGRAQIAQAAAAGAEPEAAMNPVLLKPSGTHTTQVVVMGEAVGEVDAVTYQERKPALLKIAVEALADLRSRFDVVLCEGAGSPAEINLRPHDLANMGLARAAELPVIVVGDIDRGGVFAALYGTVALLEPADQALVSGFVVNKFRGDPAILEPGLEQLQALTGRAVYGVLPFRRGLGVDAEDSLALDAPREAADAPLSRDGLEIAVVRLPRISNFTDVDALACEPGITVRFTSSPTVVARADLAILPGTKATVDDLAWLRARGLAGALRARALGGAPVLGVCGGYQMLGEIIDDMVESRAGRVQGLGLLPVETRFAAAKTLARVRGSSPFFDGEAATGYEVHHGRTSRRAGAPLLRSVDGRDEGCVSGAVVGTSWHGLCESDGVRRALLAWVAQLRGLDFQPGRQAFAAIRAARFDALGDMVAEHLDGGALTRLLESGPLPNLPVLPPAGGSWGVSPRTAGGSWGVSPRTAGGSWGVSPRTAGALR